MSDYISTSERHMETQDCTRTFDTTWPPLSEGSRAPSVWLMSLERLSLRADLALTLLRMYYDYFLARSRPPWRGIRQFRHSVSRCTAALACGHCPTLGIFDTVLMF